MALMEDVVIVSAVRTPIAKFQGSLSDFTAPQLGSLVVREAVKRAGVEASWVSGRRPWAEDCPQR
jgi:acetyl-CoA C-acetyltransferase